MKPHSPSSAHLERANQLETLLKKCTKEKLPVQLTCDLVYIAQDKTLLDGQWSVKRTLPGLCTLRAVALWGQSGGDLLGGDNDRGGWMGSAWFDTILLRP